MLTKEQIKNLKEGDKLLAEVSFVSVNENHDLTCSAPVTTIRGEVIKAFGSHHPCWLSLPPAKPKHDPCRKFRKGDIVEPCKGREVYSCEWEDCVFHKMNGKYEVQEDEKGGHVSVIDKETGIECYVSAFALELVTPVEGLKPYSIIVQPEGYHCVRIMKGTKIHSSIPFDEEECVCRTVEEAKAAAEEERDRLNAEYRNKQQ